MLSSSIFSSRSSFPRVRMSRKNFLACLTTVMLVLFDFGIALAAGAGNSDHHAPAGVGTLFWPAVNFTLYAIVIVMAYKKLAAPTLKQQRVEIKEQFESGRAELAEAQRALDVIEARSDNLEEEKAQIILSLESEGEALSASVIEKAVQDVGYQKNDLARRVQAEESKLRSELRKSVVRRATSEARALLSEELDEQRDTDLRRDVISQFRA